MPALAAAGWRIDFAKLAALRSLLGVSLDELICGNLTDDADHAALSHQEKQLLKGFRKLSPSKRAGAVALLS